MSLLGKIIHAMNSFCGCIIVLYLCSELVPNGAFLNDMITLFALQSSIIIAGSESVNERCADLRSFEKDEKEKLSECSALQSSSVEFVSVNIEDASLQFDDGLSHHGSFHESMVALTTLDGASIGDAAADPKVADTVDAIMRRHLHLLIQLCLLNPDMLESLFNLYGACAAILEKNPASSRHALACRIIRSEFCNILASLASSFSPEKVLDRVLCSDPLARKLVILTLETLFVGADNPCSTVLVAKVRLYAARYAIYEEYSKGRPDNTEVASIVDPALQLKLKFTELLVPVISGLTASEVVEQVPLIMMLCLRYGGDLEGTLGDASAEDAQNRLPSAESAMTALFHAFSRIVRPRPPPLSKSGLIIALHRYLQFKECKTLK